VGDKLLHRLVVFSIFRPPDEAGTHASSRHESLCILGNRQRTDGHLVLLGIQLTRSVLCEVPNAHSARLVPEVDVALVRMEHRRVDHHAVVVEVAHESARLEVEDLERTVFARCEEPLVVSLEVQGSDVACVALE